MPGIIVTPTIVNVVVFGSDAHSQREYNISKVPAK